MPQFFNVIRATIHEALIAEVPAVPVLPMGLPEPVHAVAAESVRLLLDYQDARLAQLYCDRLGRFVGRRGLDDAVYVEMAKQLAFRMAYLDAFRIAQLKLQELDMPGQKRGVDKRRFRIDELTSSLPQILGDPLLWFFDGCRASHRTLAFRFSTASRIGVVRLRMTAWLRRWRKLSVRYETERRWAERWLHMIERCRVKRPEAVFAVVQTATMIEDYGTGYRHSVAAWHQIIDGLVKPVLDGTLDLPDLPMVIAEARDAPRDPRGDVLRELIQQILSRPRVA